MRLKIITKTKAYVTIISCNEVKYYSNEYKPI